MASNKLTIYSSDGQKLQTTMGFFIRPTMSESRVNPSKQDITTYVSEFISTSRANNNCLVSINKKGDEVTIVGVLRTRQNARDGPAIKDFSVSETQSPGETIIDSVSRGLKEELGSLVHPKFFEQLVPGGSDVVLVVDSAAKARLVNNYERLVPLSELYDVKWVAASSVPKVSNIVKDSDIHESEIIDVIDLAYSAASLPSPLQFEKGSQTPFSAAADPVSYPNADHKIARPAAIMPRQKGPPPAPPAVVKPDLGLVQPGTSVVTWPEALPDETKDKYFKRVVGTGPGRSAAATKAHAESLGLKGGRKTIRRKKSKRSKKMGTLKKGVRRSH